MVIVVLQSGRGPIKEGLLRRARVAGLLSLSLLSACAGNASSLAAAPKPSTWAGGANTAAVASDSDQQTRPQPETADQRLEKLQEVLEQQQRMLLEQQQQITAMRAEINAMRLAAASGSAVPGYAAAPGSVTVQGAAVALPSEATGAIPRAKPSRRDVAIRVADQTGAQASGPSAGGGRETVGERPAEPSLTIADIPTLEGRGGVLTPKGTLTVEPSFTAAHTSQNRFLFRGVEILPAFLVGVIDVSELERDYVSAGLTGRYGITDSLEAQVAIPYVYRHDSINQNAASIGGSTGRRTVDGHGLGDVEVALQYQLTRGSADWPILTAGLRAKSPTGTGPFEVDRNQDGLEAELATGSGFWGLQPSITVIQPMDPLVFYGSLSYLRNFEKNVNSTIHTSAGDAFVGHVDPGDAFGISFGGAFGITENVSVSLGYEHYYITKTKQEQSSFDDATSTFGPLITTKTETAQVGSLSFGLNVTSNSGNSYSFALSAGLTDDAPDVQFTVRHPLSWEIAN